MSISKAEMFEYFSAGPTYLKKVKFSKAPEKVENRQEFVMPFSSITNIHLFCN